MKHRIPQDESPIEKRDHLFSTLNQQVCDQIDIMSFLKLIDNLLNLLALH